ncbi:MAG: hypothetical protein AVDCRST_MAG01-01-2617, partial [uncultured Rubrobacteraceae bacterium]
AAAEPEGRAGPRSRVRLVGRRRHRARGLRGRHGRSRSPGRAGRRRRGEARDRRLEPGRVHDRLGRRADRPLQGRRDGRRHKRHGGHARGGGHAPLRGGARRQHRLGGTGAPPPRRAQPGLLPPPGRDAGADPARREGRAGPGGPGPPLRAGPEALRLSLRAGRLPQRAARHRGAQPPARRPAAFARLVRPLGALRRGGRRV